jgi:hypothetical protein
MNFDGSEEEVVKRNRALSQFKAKHLVKSPHAAQKAKKFYSDERLDDSDEDQMVKRNRALSQFKAKHLVKSSAAQKAKKSYSDERRDTLARLFPSASDEYFATE